MTPHRRLIAHELGHAIVGLIAGSRRESLGSAATRLRRRPAREPGRGGRLRSLTARRPQGQGALVAGRPARRGQTRAPTVATSSGCTRKLRLSAKPRPSTPAPNSGSPAYGPGTVSGTELERNSQQLRRPETAQLSGIRTHRTPRPWGCGPGGRGFESRRSPSRNPCTRRDSTDTACGIGAAGGHLIGHPNRVPQRSRSAGRGNGRSGKHGSLRRPARARYGQVSR